MEIWIKDWSGVGEKIQTRANSCQLTWIILCHRRGAVLTELFLTAAKARRAALRGCV